MNPENENTEFEKNGSFPSADTIDIEPEFKRLPDDSLPPDDLLDWVDATGTRPELPFAQLKERVINSKYKKLLWPKSYWEPDMADSMARDICERMLVDSELVEFAKSLCKQLDAAYENVDKVIEHGRDRRSLTFFAWGLSEKDFVDPISQHLEKLCQMAYFGPFPTMRSALNDALRKLDRINYIKGLDRDDKYLELSFMLVDTDSYFSGDTAANISKFETQLKESHYFHCRLGKWIAVVVRNFDAARSFAGHFGLKAFFYFRSHKMQPDSDERIPAYDRKIPYCELWKQNGETAKGPSDDELRAAIDSIYDRYQEIAKLPDGIQHFNNSLAPGKHGNERFQERVLAGL